MKPTPPTPANTPPTPANTPPSPTYAEHYPNWTDHNRCPAFATWEAQIEHARRLGYELVPSMYHVPHWFTMLAMDAVLPKLYVLRRNGGQFEELRSAFDRPAADLAYPLFFKPAPIPKPTIADGRKFPSPLNAALHLLWLLQRLSYCEPHRDGMPCDGFRFRDGIKEARKLLAALNYEPSEENNGKPIAQDANQQPTGPT